MAKAGGDQIFVIISETIASMCKRMRLTKPGELIIITAHNELSQWGEVVDTDYERFQLQQTGSPER